VVVNPAAFASARHFAASLGLVPRQGGTGGKVKLGGRSADATALLQPVYDRFTEGFDTADLRAAKALLDGLAEPADL
jgi:transposase